MAVLDGGLFAGARLVALAETLLKVALAETILKDSGDVATVQDGTAPSAGR